MTGQGLTRHKPAHGTAQVGQTAVVDLARLGQRCGRVTEAGRGNKVGQVGHGAIVHGLKRAELIQGRQSSPKTAILPAV